MSETINKGWLRDDTTQTKFAPRTLIEQVQDNSGVPLSTFLENNYASISHTHDVDGYLPLSGGTLSGNIEITHSNNAESCYIATNSYRTGRFTSSNTGKLGIYDNTNGKWMIYSEIAGDTIYSPMSFSISGTIYEGGTALSSKYAAASHNHAASNITSGTLGVARGGTGATTFTSGEALIGAGTGAVTTRAITNNTALTHIAYNTNLMTTNTLAYWNGAYSSAGASNLTYCVKGAFGSIVTKNTGDYLPIGGGTITGNLTVNGTLTTKTISHSSAIKVNCASIGTEAVTISQSNTTRAFFKVANSTCAASFVAASDGYFGINNSNNNSWVICSDNGGTIYLGASYKLCIPTATSVGIRPNKSNDCSCGHASYLWTTVYAKTTTISASDRNQKKDIRSFDTNENYENLFFDLKPVVYKFKDGTSNRDHFGYISQDVEESLYKYGFNDKSFAGFCRDVKVDENEKPILDENGKEQWLYALRYEEFISLNTYMIQKSSKRIDDLQAENEDLKARIEKLEKIIEGLCA